MPERRIFFTPRGEYAQGRGRSVKNSVETILDCRRRERQRVWNDDHPPAESRHLGGGEERKKGFAERSLWAAQPHKGVSEPAVDTWCLISAVAIRKAPSSPNDCRWPVWNTGCLYGNEYCRLCRRKTVRSAQRCQHGSMPQPNIIIFAIETKNRQSC